ncbi:MAG: carotenoid 1,2-hydratase [Thermoanaerobaculia bacterium]|nr:carotenoid 1,2-hydratase [Thermoanaerobaculia bacterium]
MRSPLRYLLGLLVAVAALAALAVALELRARNGSHPGGATAELELAAALGGSDEAGFLRATAKRPFVFPADHGAHDGFRTEWWYVTGNLFAADGRAFGVQLTFFRNALVAGSAASPSRWRSDHVWMAHFALSDERQGTFRFAERFAREAVGLAGVTAAPFRVSLEDWSLASLTSSGSDFAPLRLAARSGDFAADLTLEPGKPPVLQGDQGLSQKGPQPGNASYYYSLTRLATRGTVTVDGETVPVTGEAWLDREWSTSALGAELAGWDWFALQLDDGRELMFYRLRRKDGASEPWSRGSLVAADGSSRTLQPEEILATPLSTWKSPSGAVYPGRWRLQLPGEALDLELTPRVAAQELAATVRYWEGAVKVAGSSHGRPVGGHGFVEMTGYGSAGAR